MFLNFHIYLVDYTNKVLLVNDEKKYNDFYWFILSGFIEKFHRPVWFSFFFLYSYDLPV